VLPADFFVLRYINEFIGVLTTDAKNENEKNTLTRNLEDLPKPKEERNGSF
jgi:hypothetical protein